MTEKQRNKGKTKIIYISIVFLCITAATAIGLLFRFLNFPETNIVVVYILFVVLTSRFTYGYWYGIAASLISTLAFNYFFAAPYYTLFVSDISYFITFTIMTITAIITSALTSKVRKNVLEAQEKEAEASALYKLTNQLTDAVDLYDITSITVRTISEIMNYNVSCLFFDESGQAEQYFIHQSNPQEQIHWNGEDIIDIKNRMKELKTPYFIGVEFYDWPICWRDVLLGVFRIPKSNAENMNRAQMRLIRSMIESTALAMDRFLNAQERIKSKEEITKERYRSNLLRAISHDLRTPLSGIMGTSEMLMDMTDKSDHRYSLAEDIYKDANWLHSLVENILSLTRLQDGKLVLNKEMEAVEEVIGSVINAMKKRAPDHEITVNIPSEVLLIPMEAKLIGQVFINLLDNAVKHTPPEKEISITVKEDKKERIAIFSVADRGTGIAVADLPNIFRIFYTTHGRESVVERGMGLGLSICESIVTAHGGTIGAHNRGQDSGTEIIFTLPMEAKENAKA